MKLNQWTIALAAAGVVSLGSVVQAEEAQQHPVLSALSSTTLSGYVSTSAIWKLGTGNANMPGRVFDGATKQDGFNLDVVKLSLEKPLTEEQWSAGYKVDLLFGPDANAFGSVSSGVNAGDFAIKQAYVNMRAPVGNGLDIKMGVFDNILGYESFDAGSDPNYSRSYGYSLEPLNHTGILASYKVSESVSIVGGVANTLDQTVNGRPWRIYPGTGVLPARESEKTYLALLSLTAPESFGSLKGASLYGGVDNGLNSGAASASRIYSYYAGVTIPTPLTGLAIGAAYDYRGTTQNGPVNSTYANAVSMYLSYQATEKLKLNNRVELASGTAGTWVGTTRGTANIGTANQDEFFGETFTVDYSLWANVISRVEFRWDHDMKGGPGVFGSTNPDGTARDKNAFSLALNVIYKF